MNTGSRYRIRSRRLAPAALAAVLIAAVAPGASGALGSRGSTSAGGSGVRVYRVGQGTPTSVIDATADPAAAAAALNTGCADLSNCSWSAGKPVVGWGPWRILGDVLYNCSDPSTGANAVTAVGVSDDRTETTSLSEKVSLKVSLGFLGLEKTSVDFEAYSKQGESFTTGVSVTTGVPVAPGQKGWTESRARSILVTGDAYITSGINGLIEVKGLDLSFPYPDPSNPLGNALYAGTAVKMSDNDVASRCGAVSGLGGVRQGGSPRSYKLTVCAVTPGSRRTRCQVRKATGALPPRQTRATVLLTAKGHTYASGTDVNGTIRLTRRRSIPPGAYTLTLRRRVVPLRIRPGAGVTTLSTIVSVVLR